MSARVKVPSSRQPFWTEQALRPRYDIARLRPASLPKGNRFETRDDAQDVVERHLARLEEASGSWARTAIRAVEACDDDQPCRNPLCGHCTRAFRRWFSGEGLHVISTDPRPAIIVTVLFRVVPVDELADISLLAVKDLLRKRIRRAGMLNVIAIGGIEVGFKKRLGLVLHAHLLLFGATGKQLKTLKSSFANRGIEDAFTKQRLRHPAKQLSYLLKFTSYHRPGQQTGPRKPRAYPLPRTQFDAWARWISDIRFEDVLFLCGVRRQRHRLKPVPSRRR